MKTNQNAVIRLLFSICLIPVGALMIALHNDSPGGLLLSHIGFAFIVAGVLSTFHEAVLGKFEQGEAAATIADETYKRLQQLPLGATGIRLVTTIRKRYEGYYRWVMSSGPQEIFLAGRSVLHRVHTDLKEKGRESVEEAIARQLREGSKFRLLLVDPRSNLVPRLAKDEGQSPEELLADVATSLGVCTRLHGLLRTQGVPSSARLEICVFDDIPYFAYHCVDDYMVVGFYFASTLGHQSAAFEVIDRKTKEFFADHFQSILARARPTYIVRIDPNSGRVQLNETLLRDLRESIAGSIGDLATESRMSGST